MRWAATYHSSGWLVSCFDPDASAGHALMRQGDIRREATISATVRKADWVMCCLPERLELLQMVLQRVQVEAPHSAVVSVIARTFDVEAIQACALRPAQVVRVTEARDGTLSLGVTERNTSELRQQAEAVLAEQAAVMSMAWEPAGWSQDVGAESA